MQDRMKKASAEVIIARFPGEHRIKLIEETIERKKAEGKSENEYKSLSEELSKLLEIADDFKTSKWLKVVAEREKHFSLLYKKTKKDVFTKLYTLEFDGGKCFNCGKPWVEQKIDNAYLKGRYFTPNCDCFIQCPECETWLYDKQYEFNGNLIWCKECGFKLVEEETGKKRYGSEYFAWYKNQSREKQIKMRRG